MMRMSSFLLLFVASAASFAADLKPSPADPRIKTVRYNARDVVTLHTHALINTHVRFADYEKIEDIAAGDTEAWLVAKNADENGFFVKPKEPGVFTNLVIRTTERVYTFAVTAAATEATVSSPDLTFMVSFEYPDDEIRRAEQAQKVRDVTVSPEPISPESWNFRYEYSGSKVIKPFKVMDDGKFVYFDFGDRAAVPAIFAVDANGNESVVNFHRRGRYIVVERLERQFTLRDGKEATCIFNAAKGDLPPATRKNRREPV